jgi:hypothetical protein
MKLLKLYITIYLVSVMAMGSHAATTLSVETPIVGTSDLTKAQMWHNLRQWVSLTFENKDVIDMEDAETGTMILKWMCPVKQRSSFIVSNVSATYVIDIRDGKYRVMLHSPRAIMSQNVPENVWEIGKGPRASHDIKQLINISNNYMNSKLEWAIDAKLTSVDEYLFEKLSSIEQYKSERDKERNNINSEWTDAQQEWSIVHDVITGMRDLNNTMLSSLQQALTIADDF